MRFSLMRNSYARLLVVTFFALGFSIGLWVATHKLSQRYGEVLQGKNETIDLMIEEIKNECSELYGYSKKLEQENRVLKEKIRDLKSQ